MQLGTIDEVEDDPKEQGRHLNAVDNKRLKSPNCRRQNASKNPEANNTSGLKDHEKPQSDLLNDLNTRLEIRRKSEDLASLDALEREAFNQTLIYAAKTALNTIHAAKELNIENEIDSSGNVLNIEEIDETARLTPDLRPSRQNKCTNCTPKSGRRNSRRESNVLSNARKCSACETDQDINRMATRRKTTRRKESVILIPVKQVKELTPAQISEIKKSFNDLDANKDGRVSKRELTLGAYRLGMNPTEDDVDSMFKTADKNGDGFIDFNEYVDMMKQNYVTIDIERERMKAAFAMLDYDGDGNISKEELVKALVTKHSGITEADIDEILRDADMDGNDQIDFNEFVDSTICAKLF